MPSSLAATQSSPTDGPLASWKDVFFTILTHEFGHSLGLQHTKLSGIMTTLVTRTSTKASPLDADDIAGISFLYPTAAFLANTGSVQGTVTLSGTGVNLASVVAISPSTGAAIGAMTNPDGTYSIDGMPPGQDYLVYVHPLPPNQEGLYPGDIAPPQDRNGVPFPANTGFVSQFFNGANGTRTWSQASAVNVTAGNVTGGVNFAVQKSGGPAIYDMYVYGYQGPARNVPVQGPSLSGTGNSLSFYATGAVTNTSKCTFAPGFSLSLIGAAAQLYGTSCYAGSGGYGLTYVDANSVAQATPVALVINTASDMYVLPAAITIVPSAAPTISSVTLAGDQTGVHHAVVAGTNLRTNTRILFDGAAASLIGVNSDGSLTVSAPPASGGYTATVEALGSDGQSSAQALGTAPPPAFSYNSAAAPSVTVTPASVPAGVDTMIEIDGNGTNFVDGVPSVGFGSSDVVVRGLWVLSPTRILLNVSVNPAATPANTTITVTSGLQLVTMSAGFQILPANPQQVSLRVPVVDLLTGFSAVPVGDFAVIGLVGPVDSINAWTLTIDGQPVAFTTNVNRQLVAQVPAGTSLGPVVVRLTGPNGEVVPAIVMQVDPPPPVITGANGASGASLDSSHPAHIGETLTVSVTGLGDMNNPPPCTNVHINVGGVDHLASALAAMSSSGVWQVQFVLAQLAPTGPQPLTVGIGMRQSAPITITVTR